MKPSRQRFRIVTSGAEFGRELPLDIGDWDDEDLRCAGLRRVRPDPFADLMAEGKAEPTDPTAERKRIAAVIDREIAMRADELRRGGVRNPVTQAEREVAKRWRHASGAALNRWLRRNR